MGCAMCHKLNKTMEPLGDFCSTLPCLFKEDAVAENSPLIFSLFVLDMLCLYVRFVVIGL